MAHDPHAKTLRPWLRENLGKTCLAPLTTTDYLALDAAVHIAALWVQTGDREVPNAFGAVVRTMQPTVRYLAYHSIAHAGDWPLRMRLWSLSGLPSLPPFPRCKNEPREGEE